jgi:hypothetical protein
LRHVAYPGVQEVFATGSGDRVALVEVVGGLE